MDYRKKHDLWKGSLIEYVDARTPLEPHKPPRPFEGTVDVRYEHAHAKEAESKAALLRKWREGYLEAYGESSLAELEKNLKAVGQGRLVFHKEHGFGVVTSAGSQKKKKGEYIRIKFSGEDKSRKVSYPGDFYTGTLTFVPESQEIRERYDLHFCEPKKKPLKSAAKKPMPPKVNEAELCWGLERGAAVRHSVYGDGKVVSSNAEFVRVRFWDHQTRIFRPSTSLEREPLRRIE